MPLSCIASMVLAIAGATSADRWKVLVFGKVCTKNTKLGRSKL